MLLTCKNHPHLVWRCKDIAYSPEANEGRGGYNGMRNIFFFGVAVEGILGHSTYDPKTGIVHHECSCHSRDLIGIPGTEEGGG